MEDEFAERGFRGQQVFTFVRAARGEDPLAVVSPDPGGMKRAELLREDLEARTGRPVAKGIVDKHRSQGVVTGDLFAGDVRDRTVVIVDDLISTGTTLRRAAAAARAHGARRVVAMATHGLFVGGAAGLMADPAIDRIVVTDTVPPVRVDPAVLGGRLVVLPAARLFAEAIRRANGGGPAGDPVTPGAAPA